MSLRKGVRCCPCDNFDEEGVIELDGVDIKVDSSYVRRFEDNGSSFYYVDCSSVIDFRQCNCKREYLVGTGYVGEDCRSNKKLVRLDLGERMLMMAVSEDKIIDLS